MHHHKAIVVAIALTIAIAFMSRYATWLIAEYHYIAAHLATP
jgi:hypothetical protein